jgi:hypothetical protein
MRVPALLLMILDNKHGCGSVTFYLKDPDPFENTMKFNIEKRVIYQQKSFSCEYIILKRNTYLMLDSLPMMGQLI